MKTSIIGAHYPEEVLGINRVLSYSYWNQSGIGIVIVAIEGYADDWAAYIGAGTAGISEEETVRYICRKGCKLSRRKAAAWFPQFPIKRYRE
mgnify:CR=1 FL=1